MVRTRIAPSPTGDDLHIGNLYTALLCYVFAKKHNGSFIVRIEDTDRERLIEGSEQRILKTLKNFGLLYDEGPDKGEKFGPYRQSDRLDIYKKHVEVLLDKKVAYYCVCTKERLDDLRKKQQEKKELPRYDKHCLGMQEEVSKKVKAGEKHVVRLNLPPSTTIKFEDVVRGEIVFETANIDDQVLLKSDGYPTYHLAVVVDDHLMEISHVIRAEDWISSTPKHVFLYDAFGWERPVFCHVPLLRNPDKSKLSKRKNPVWSSWYLDNGYLPEAILNYLALMGWSHPQEKEIFALSEFMSLFELNDLKPVGPIFDIAKLTWMNQQYIQKLDLHNLKLRISQFSSNVHHLDEAAFEKLLQLTYNRMETLKDFDKLTASFIKEPERKARDEKEKEVARSVMGDLKTISEWKKDNIFSSLKKALDQHSIRMPVLYYIFTGEDRGLPLPESLEIMGKEKVLKRLELFV